MNIPSSKYLDDEAYSVLDYNTYIANRINLHIKQCFHSKIHFAKLSDLMSDAYKLYLPAADHHINMLPRCHLDLGTRSALLSVCVGKTFDAFMSVRTI